MRHLWPACVLVLWVLGFPRPGAAQVEKIHALLARPEILCGRFDQTKQLVGLKKPFLSSGRFCVVTGKGVLWRTLQPFAGTVRLTREEIVQMQGDRVTMRLNARQEPTVRLINSVLFSLLAGDLAQLEKLFAVEATVNKSSWSVSLKAREPGLAKVVAIISLDGGAYVTHVAIDEASGDRTRIVFSAIQTGDEAMSSDEAALF
jgi:hypothetical protein